MHDIDLSRPSYVHVHCTCNEGTVLNMSTRAVKEMILTDHINTPSIQFSAGTYTHIWYKFTTCTRLLHTHACNTHHKPRYLRCSVPGQLMWQQSLDGAVIIPCWLCLHLHIALYFLLWPGTTLY